MPLDPRLADDYSPADEARDRLLDAKDAKHREQTKAPDALRAPRCQCENKHTYQDEDGERRCLCGRQV